MTEATVQDEGVAEEVDINDAEVPGWAKEGTEDDDFAVEGEDVSSAKPMSNEDWIEPAKGVTFEITNALPDAYTPADKSEWMKFNMKLYVRIGDKGVDGKGRYAGKMFFPRILVAVNREAYDFTVNAAGKPTQWYNKKDGGAFGEYNELLTALGFPNSPSPRNDAAFRKGLVGRKFVADITKDKREVYDKATKKSVRVEGEFENHLRNLRPVTSTAAPQPEVEAARA